MAGSGAIRAARAFVELFADSSKLGPSLKAAADKVKSFGDSIGSLGVKAFAGATAAAAAFGAAVNNAFTRFRGNLRGIDAANLLIFEAVLTKLKTAAQLVALVAGLALLPVLNRLGAGVGVLVGQLAIWLRQNPGIVTSVAQIVAIVAVAGVGLIVLAKAISIVSTVVIGVKFALGFFVSLLSLIPAAIGLILSPIGLVVAAVALMGAQFVDFGGIWSDMSEIFKTAWGGIVAAVKAGDLGLAVQIALAAVGAAWDALISGLRTAWVAFWDYAKAVQREAIDALAQAFNTWWANFRAGLGEIKALAKRAGVAVQMPFLTKEEEQGKLAEIERDRISGLTQINQEKQGVAGQLQAMSGEEKSAVAAAAEAIAAEVMPAAAGGPAGGSVAGGAAGQSFADKLKELVEKAKGEQLKGAGAPLLLGPDLGITKEGGRASDSSSGASGSFSAFASARFGATVTTTDTLLERILEINKKQLDEQKKGAVTFT